MSFEQFSLFVTMIGYFGYIFYVFYYYDVDDIHIFDTAIYIGGAGTFFGYFFEFFTFKGIGYIIGLLVGLWVANEERKRKEKDGEPE